MMENSTPTEAKSKTPLIVAGIVVVVIIILVAAFALSNQPKTDSSLNQQNPAPTSQTVQQPTTVSVKYNNGEYSAVGNYTSPGGEESIDLSLTLTDDIVTNATVVSNATRPISKKMQAAFIEGFREQVVGRKIDDISVTKVSSSSLTPKGFMNALEQVKTQAKT